MQKKSPSIRQFASIGLVGLLLAASLVACSETDVVAKVAVSSFAAVTQKMAPQISLNSAEAAWQIDSPAGDSFRIAQDFARPDADGESPDFELDFDAAPFVAAGLDASKLTGTPGLPYRLESGRLMLHFNWGDSPLKADPATSAPPSDALAGINQSFRQIIGTYRDRVGYHEKLDHYGLALGDGNMLEWAKDLASNDKDLVFILNPGPLIAAGVDPAKVEGWVFAKVEIKNASGQSEQVDKFLKPFNLD